MQNPTVGRVSSEYSTSRKHPVTGRKMPHLGIDIAAPVGTPIEAAYGGKVISVRTSSYPGDQRTVAVNPGRTGNHVYIQNPDGERQWYGHCDDVRVKVGDTVKAGQVIATVGKTGVVTGPHVHFEVHDKHGRTRNPRVDFKAHKVTPGVDPVGDVKPQASVKPRPTTPAAKPPAPTKPKPKTYRTLVKGSTGADVLALSRALRKKGYTKQGDTSVFTEQLRINVLDWQKRKGLYKDAKAGPITQKSLGL